MRFIYKDGPYTHFMGRLFAFGLPTNITDRATIQALEKHPGFVAVREEEMEKTPIPDVCPKCGKTVKRGKVMHQKYCKGPK